MAEEKKLPNFEDDGTEDFGDDSTENTSKTEETPKKVQSSKENAKFKQMRLEQEEKIKKEAYEKGLSDGRVKGTQTNPYTGTPIRDESDLEILDIQKELEEDGKDPIQDLPAYFASKNREKREKANQEKKTNDEIQARAQKDLQDFYDAGYSKADLDEFLGKVSTGRWKDFGDAIAKGSISPAKAYVIMKQIEGDISEEVKKKEEAKKISIPPSPTGSNKTQKSYDEMTLKEINEAYNRRYKKNA